jgi:hypothetical protein
MQIACLDVPRDGWARDRCQVTRYDNRDERIIAYALTDLD